MKKRINNWLITTSAIWILYFIIWVCRCFVTWEIIHPFDWLIEIPVETTDYRGGILSTWFIVTFIKYIVVFTTDLKSSIKESLKQTES